MKNLQNINVLSFLRSLIKINSIQKKFTLPISLLVCFLVIIFSYIRMNSALNEGRNQLNTKGELLVGFMANSLVDPVWNFNDKGIENFSKAIFKDNDVVSIIVKNAEKEDLF